jgi:hypothetical protein
LRVVASAALVAAGAAGAAAMAFATAAVWAGVSASADAVVEGRPWGAAFEKNVCGQCGVGRGLWV